MLLLCDRRFAMEGVMPSIGRVAVATAAVAAYAAVNVAVATVGASQARGLWGNVL